MDAKKMVGIVGMLFASAACDVPPDAAQQQQDTVQQEVKVGPGPAAPGDEDACTVELRSCMSWCLFFRGGLEQFRCYSDCDRQYWACLLGPVR